MAEIKVKGLAELSVVLTQFPAKFQRNTMRRALRKGMNVVKPVAQGHVHSVSGKLARGLKVSTNSRAGKVWASLKATGPHAFVAKFLEFGTKAHTIEPKNRKALTFGGEFYRRVKNNPGIGKGSKAFMRKSLDQMAGPAVVAVGEAVRADLATKGGIDVAYIEIAEA